MHYESEMNLNNVFFLYYSCIKWVVDAKKRSYPPGNVCASEIHGWISVIYVCYIMLLLIYVDFIWSKKYFCVIQSD